MPVDSNQDGQTGLEQQVKKITQTYLDIVMFKADPIHFVRLTKRDDPKFLLQNGACGMLVVDAPSYVNTSNYFWNYSLNSVFST